MIEQWLTEEEWDDYRLAQKYVERIKRKLSNLTLKEETTLKSYESLATCRELMADAKRCIQDDLSGMSFDEYQAKQLEERGKEIYDKLAKQLAGLPREVGKDES